MIVKKLEVFVIVVIIASIGIIYAFNQKSVQKNVKTQNQQALVSQIEYPGQDDRSALDLLKVNHQVEAKHYSFGDLVTSIDGIKPDSKHFWAMYVNGQFSQVGASAYITKNSDLIKWQIEEVK